VYERELFRQAADYAADFIETLETRPIRAEADVEELTSALGGRLPEGPTDPRAVIASLVESAEPGLCATPSGRFFGFVIGGGVSNWRTTREDAERSAAAVLAAASVPA
jgi:hypothetical protein